MKKTNNNIKQCEASELWAEYFEKAKPDMGVQWEETIFPRIKDSDFETCIDLACGGGRNTEKLVPLCEKIYAIDLNQYAIDIAKKYLKERLSKKDFSKITFIKNTGTDLTRIKDNSISFIYSWDSGVHMSRDVIRDYVKEFKRVLKTPGTGFFHHSNFGAKEFNHIDPRFKAIVNIEGIGINNPHWRTDMSAGDFKDFCDESGLDCTKQDIIDWGIKNLNCISMFQSNEI